MLVERFTVTSKQCDGIKSQLNKIKRLVSQEGGSPIHPGIVASALENIIEGKFTLYKKENTILKLLSKGESIIIDACDGTETLANAKEVFLFGIDPDFKNWHTNNPDIATEETEVNVHELVKDSTFLQIFGSLELDLYKLCLTQAQIKSFCKKHPQLLRQHGYATIFLFRASDQFFVASVSVIADDMRVGIHRFGDGSWWSAEYSHRVIALKLNS